MHGQRSTKPSIHLCILDLMKMFMELTVLVNTSGTNISDEISSWAQFLLLGLCHKCLRVLEIPHFAGCLLNPGVGWIPDLNDYLP